MLTFLRRAFPLMQLAPDGGSNGGDGGSSATPPATPPTPPTPPPPPPVVETDAEKLADMSDEEFDRLAAEGVEKKTDDVTPPATPPPPKKFAEKFESSDALIEGVNAASESLKLPKDTFSDLIEAAKGSGKYESIERLYAKLDAAVTTQSASQPPPPPPPPPASSSDTVSITQEERDAVLGQVLQVSLQEFQNSSLGREMTEKGIPIPTNSEELDELVADHPHYATMMRIKFSEISEKNLREAEEAVRAAKTVATHEKNVIDSDKAEVKAIGQKYGVDITDAEIDSVIEVVKAVPYNYELRYGQKFLRAGVIRDAFISKNVPKMIEAVRLKAEADGRVQAAKDLKAAHTDADLSPSTAGLPGAKAGTKPPVKIEDLTQEQRESLTDEELDRLTNR